MSVAFRRESDDEHLEPKFELPLPPGPNRVTARGLAQIRARVAELEAVLGTLTEETGIAATRRDLRYWNTRLATAELADAPDGTTVAFGTTVTIRLEGRERSIRIVGDDEAHPASGFLSFSAPLCRAIMGAEVGDVVDFAGKPDGIEVLAIDVASD
ncbi:GreA/GreB family elongation factor [Altericroceibacterium xinjiangense]|uniref:GreA/GreB family elongation factor n=1 Tax=Altericroceibacterium xinjiangense TaxID=762261 RepID=UPI000F7E4C19|nr:GreA/GreB family elongation factor [Altericroceibacterium xinjiangense]